MTVKSVGEFLQTTDITGLQCLTTSTAAGVISGGRSERLCHVHKSSTTGALRLDDDPGTQIEPSHGAAPSFRHTTLAFQFPPHHLRTRSPPHSSYSALDTPTLANSSVCANAAIPRHASSDGSAARTILSGISGGRIGRSVTWRRSERPGIRAGVPVRKTF